MSAAEQKSDQSLVREICSLVEKRIGVQFGARQHSMVLGRLKRRLFELQLGSLADYRAYLSQTPREMDMLLSLLTTHYTYFFREFIQFEELENCLPGIAIRAKERGSNRIDVLSAACSRGQEVYSLAMHLKKHLPEISPGMDFRVFGADVDSESVKVASNGVYRHDDIKAVPVSYIDTHWARGTKEISAFVKAKKSIREHCEFSVLNLLDLNSLEGRKFDVIFCRNVFIYFTGEQIKAVSESLARHLHPGGRFFLGLTESLHGLDVPLKSMGPSIYGRVDEASRPGKPMRAPAAQLPASARIPSPLRVVCIDDSPSILTLLQSVFEKDSGFEIVGTAKNGEEGMKVIQQAHPDVVTLDIHMPVCDGIQFLKNYPKGSAPVVVVSSVSREDAGLAFESLKLGAFDYVEKPALSNLEQRADELRAKLKAAYRCRHTPPVLSAVDVEFKRSLKIERPDRCARIVLFSLADQERCQDLLAELAVSKVPVFLALEGANSVLPEIRERLAAATGLGVNMCAAGVTGSHFLGDWQQTVAEVSKRAFERVSVMVLGEASAHSAKAMPSLSGAQLILEDLGEGKGTAPLFELASEVVPKTSFIYHSDKFCRPRKKWELSHEP